MSARILITTLIASVGFGACAPTRTREAPRRVVSECTLGQPVAAPADSAMVVLTSPVDLRNEPHATTWGERFVFDLAFASPSRADCRGHPLGAVAYDARASGRSTLLEPLPGVTVPRLLVQSVTETDARDPIDAGVDLLITESPALIAYATSRADVASVPLAWNRTWVLALPHGLIAGFDSSIGSRAALARDVVRVDARASESSYWWWNDDRCGLPADQAAAPRPLASSRIVYPRDEPVGRALAERLVALTGGRAVALGLAPNAFPLAVRSGADLAYILPLWRMTREPCRDVADLAATAPWLTRAAPIPLVDTRLLAAVRRDRLNLAFAWDSTLTVSQTPP